MQLEGVVFGIALVALLQVAREGLWPHIVGLLPARQRAAPKPADPLARRAPAAGTDSALEIGRGEALLVLDQARKQFGGLVAVNDVSFKVRRGEIVALIGPNGAGKSTTFNLITGVAALTAGTVRYDGVEISGTSPRVIARHGVARTFQHVKLNPDMTVLENVALGAHLRGRAGILAAMLRLDRRDEARLLAEAARQIARIGLAEHMMKPAGSLALGQQRMVEIARALAIDPELLLLDEPAAGLRHFEKTALADLLGRLRGRGHERPAGRARHGLRHGAHRPHRGARFRHQDRRRPARGDQDPSRGAGSLSRRRRMTETLLAIETVSVAYGKVQAVRGVSLNVEAGEIVTVIGANGAGKSTLLNATIGALGAQGPSGSSARTSPGSMSRTGWRAACSWCPSGASCSPP